MLGMARSITQLAQGGVHVQLRVAALPALLCCKAVHAVHCPRRAVRMGPWAVLGVQRPCTGEPCHCPSQTPATHRLRVLLQVEEGKPLRAWWQGWWQGLGLHSNPGRSCVVFVSSSSSSSTGSGAGTTPSFNTPGSGAEQSPPPHFMAPTGRHAAGHSTDSPADTHEVVVPVNEGWAQLDDARGIGRGALKLPQARVGDAPQAEELRRGWVGLVRGCSCTPTVPSVPLGKGLHPKACFERCAVDAAGGTHLVRGRVQVYGQVQAGQGVLVLLLAQVHLGGAPQLHRGVRGRVVGGRRWGRARLCGHTHAFAHGMRGMRASTRVRQQCGVVRA